MASRYDPDRKCRFGAMDETTFYTEATEVNGAYFKALTAEWAKKGGTLQWEAGGVGLRSPIGGKPAAESVSSRQPSRARRTGSNFH